MKVTTVEPGGSELTNATGHDCIDGLELYPWDQSPSCVSNNIWKLFRAYVCGMLTVLAAEQGCD